MKRIFDIIFSFFGILLLSPFLFIISLWVLIDSPGGIFYIQQRAGRGENYFGLIKFRSMCTGSDKKGLLTVGAKDNRITKSGLFIRKYKIDELPQLYNVLKGDMSFVGPRPEVKKYVDLYTKSQLSVLEVRPGITDLASIEYFSENELLAKAKDPEQTYIKDIMPHKLELNLRYINDRGFGKDFIIILRTLGKIIS